MTPLKIIVDAADTLGPLPPIWRSFGYDEINWTYTPRGKRIFREIAGLSPAPYYIRCHNSLTSGNGLSTPTKGSCNVCRINADGKSEYNFTLLDQVIATFLENNCKPIIELGFMPDALSKGPRPKPTYDYRGNDLWKYPPRDYRQWQQLVFETVKHYLEKYGAEEVGEWYWEVWNEPDTPGFFSGALKDYLKLYDFAAAGAAQAFADIKIGGPALAHQKKFLDKFLKHCREGKNFVTGERGSRLDFISLHAKGTGWPLPGQPFAMPSLKKIMAQLQGYRDVIQKYPALRQTEILLDECDMAVGTNFGVYDFPEYEFHNSEYYPVFVVRMAKRLFDFIRDSGWRVRLFTTWAFYYEGKRFFEGNRALFDNENIQRPIFNAFQMFEMLGDTRLNLQTLPAEGEASAQSDFPQIDGLATRAAAGNLAICIWNFAENPLQAAPRLIELEINSNGPNLFSKGDVAIERFQIDGEHSNSYSAWKKLGAPQDPTSKQIERIKMSAGLQLVESSTDVLVSQGKILYKFELPAPGVSLIKIQRKK
jgi:xylan 1,4-beta-xylosidase